MKKILAMLIIASSSASGMVGNAEKNNEQRTGRRPIFEIYFGSSTSGTSSKEIVSQDLSDNNLNQNGTFGWHEELGDYPDSGLNFCSDNEGYCSDTKHQLEDSEEVIDIGRRLSIQEYYNGSKNSAQKYNNPRKENINDSEKERNLARIRDVNKVINPARGIDSSDYKNADWSGVFNLSESDRNDFRKKSNKTANIRKKVEEYQRLEEIKNQPDSYEKSIKQQKKILEYLITKEGDVRKKIDNLNSELKSIKEKFLEFSREGAAPQWLDELIEEQRRIIGELICLQEALRISVKTINTTSNSDDLLEKIFIPTTLDAEDLRNLQNIDPGLRSVLSRLISTSNPGIGKVIHLNNLESFTLNCDDILHMISYDSNFGKRQFFLNCPNLRKLKVINYKENDENKQLVQSILCTASNLEELDLSNNRLSNNDLHTLLYMGNWSSNVKKLNLQNNSISSVPMALYRCIKLEDLNLENNAWNPSHVNSPSFITINAFLCLKNGLPNLKRLNIAGIANINNFRYTKWNFSDALEEMTLDYELLPCIWGMEKETFFRVPGNPDKYIVKFKKGI